MVHLLQLLRLQRCGESLEKAVRKVVADIDAVISVSVRRGLMMKVPKEVVGMKVIRIRSRSRCREI